MSKLKKFMNWLSIPLATAGVWILATPIMNYARDVSLNSYILAIIGFSLMVIGGLFSK